MVKPKTINKVKGFLLSEKELKAIKEVNYKGTKYYFVENMGIDEPDYNEVIKNLLISGLTKKMICEEIGMSMSWLNGSLKNQYGTYEMARIRQIITERNELTNVNPV